jgi:short-subunit dehydrogenase
MRVLITGASGGIGEAFARIYAKRGDELILVGRNLEKLEKLGRELESRVHIFQLDLSQKESPKKLFEFAKEFKIDILINNAGVGMYGNFLESDIEENLAMVQLNISSLMELTHLFANQMLERGSGKILNVSSIAGFQPIPKFASYSASKSFVLHFSETLNYELKGSGVQISALCPGATKTEFDKRAKMENAPLFQKGVMSAEKVAEIGVRGLEKGNTVTVTGFKNRFLSFMAGSNPFRDINIKIADLSVNGGEK